MPQDNYEKSGVSMEKNTGAWNEHLISVRASMDDVMYRTKIATSTLGLFDLQEVRLGFPGKNLCWGLCV